MIIPSRIIEGRLIIDTTLRLSIPTPFKAKTLFCVVFSICYKILDKDKI